MPKLEITLTAEHADLSRNEKNELIVHMVGVDEADLQAALDKMHAEQQPLPPSTQQQVG